MSAPPDLYDSEVEEIGRVVAILKERAGSRSLNYNDFEREIRERFHAIGFNVDVNWYTYEAGGVPVAGSAMPEITVTGRLTAFDPDKQVWEVVNNILELPGQSKGEWIKSGDAARQARQGHGHR